MVRDGYILFIGRYGFLVFVKYTKHAPSSLLRRARAWEYAIDRNSCHRPCPPPYGGIRPSARRPHRQLALKRLSKSDTAKLGGWSGTGNMKLTSLGWMSKRSLRPLDAFWSTVRLPTHRVAWGQSGFISRASDAPTMLEPVIASKAAQSVTRCFSSPCFTRPPVPHAPLLHTRHKQALMRIPTGE